MKHRCINLGPFLGLWDVIPMETPNMRIGAQNSTGFSRVFVTEEKMTFSGGPNNRMQTQIISIHRCVESISTPSKKLSPQKT